MSKKTDTIIHSTVKPGFCTGCGICAGICPSGALTMCLDKWGKYSPVFNINKCTDCGMCVVVCPQNPENPDSHEISIKKFSKSQGLHFKENIGFYISCYSGNVKDHAERWHSSSGGIATWLLTQLLDEVDAVIAVEPTGISEPLFSFRVCKTPEDIYKTKKSAYYPVEMSEVIRYIQENEGKYAVIGLPCFIRGLELARLKLKKLDERISYSLGLVCGQLKSTFYTRYLLSLAGEDFNTGSVSYRTKVKNLNSSNYAFSSFNKGKQSPNQLLFEDGPLEAWCGGWFKLSGCNFCDDIFAECADIALMDAWLPEFTKDSAGQNLAIVRDYRLLNFLNKGEVENKIIWNKISSAKVVKSQAGVISIKRQKNFHLRGLFRRMGKSVPCKRDLKSSHRSNPIIGLDLYWEGILDKIRMNVIRRKKGVFDIQRFKKEIFFWSILIKFIRIPEKLFFVIYHKFAIVFKKG